MTITVAREPLGGASTPSPETARRTPRASDVRMIAVFVGVAAWVVSFAGSWIPSLWGDEAVSIMSAERSLPSLFTALGHIDAVHGLYYVFLHGWIDVFGSSALSVRLPSALAVGAAAAGTVLIGDLLLTRRVGVIGGIVLALLPRVTYIGIEARGFALGTAVAVWLTVLFLTLVRRGGRGWMWWLAYSVALALATYLFLYVALLAVAHAVFLMTTQRSRGTRLRWFAAVALAIVLSGPLLVYADMQSGQIVGGASPVTLDSVFVQPWFGSPWLALACWALILIGLLASVRSHRGGLMLLAWLLAPLAVILTANAVLGPMYAARYVAFCAPAAALLIAAGITSIGRNWTAGSLVRGSIGVLLVSLVVPGYLAQRGPFAMDDGNDWGQVSAIVGAHARPGDTIVFGLASRPSRMPRLAMYAYPADYQGLRNIELVTPYSQLPALRDRVTSLKSVAGDLADATTVWAVELLPRAGKGLPSDVAALQQLGFTLVRQFPVHRDGVYELIRSAP